MAVYQPVHMLHERHGAKSGLQVLCLAVERQLRQVQQRLLELISDSCICDQIPSVAKITPQQALLLFQISNGLTRIDELRAQTVLGVETMMLDLAQLADAGLLVLQHLRLHPPHGVALTASGASFAQLVRRLCDQAPASALPSYLNLENGHPVITLRLEQLNASLQRLNPYRG